MPDRRSEVRMLCADLIEICWQDGAGKPQKAQAVLEDISASGACLQLEVPVPLDVTIRWKSPKKEFSGSVRYCVYREIGYFVGVQFDASSRWSQRMYRPQHMLNPAKLLPRD